MVETYIGTWVATVTVPESVTHVARARYKRACLAFDVTIAAAVLLLNYIPVCLAISRYEAPCMNPSNLNHAKAVKHICLGG